MPYDWTKFVPITVLAVVPNVITARIDLPANTAQELIAYAKANPGKVTYASQGNGSTSHLSAQMLATMAGIEMVHIPYKGEGPALVDLTAGRVDIFIGNISAALRFEKARQLKFLGVASRTRSPVAPDVPSAAEIGLPDLISSAWFALVVPPGTPRRHRAEDQCRRGCRAEIARRAQPLSRAGRGAAGRHRRRQRPLSSRPKKCAGARSSVRPM